jgi:uncharacterized protein DUF4115
VKRVTDVPDSPETIAALIAAADHRLNALSREVDRSLASNAPEQRPAAVTPAPPPPRPPAVGVAPRAQPAAMRIAHPAPSVVAQFVAGMVLRARRWWPRGLAANAAVGVAAAALLVFFLWPTPQPAAQAQQSPQTEPPVESARPASTAPAAAVQSDVVPAGLTMTLVASSQCWIRAVADGAKTIERILRAGETVELRGENQIVLRVGDAAAVRVTINGQAMAPLGARGEVITHRFSRADRAL